MKTMAVGAFVGAGEFVRKSGVVDSSGPGVIAKVVTEVPVGSAVATATSVIGKGGLGIADEMGSFAPGIGLFLTKSGVADSSGTGCTISVTGGVLVGTGVFGAKPSVAESSGLRLRPRLTLELLSEALSQQGHP